MTCWLTPEFHFEANIRADALYADRVLKRAHRLIAVSENSRRDAISVLGIPEERIVVIHPGVADHFFNVPMEEIAHVRAKLQLTRPYVLSLGTIEPRKNIDRLLTAWSILRKELRKEFQLVIAGPLGWAPEATKAALLRADQRCPQSEVRYLGYVAERDLPGLIAGATTLVYPSLYEGFGFPIAQAMASGIPVVTSNTSSLPEVAGEAAEYADPLSVESIHVSIQKVLESEELRGELGRRGRRRSEKFRWEISASRTWALWSDLAS